MNDDDIRAALGRPAADLPPLDPTKVIAGARRRRIRSLAAAGVASAAVVAIATVGILAAANGLSGAAPPGPAVAGGPDSPGPPSSTTMPSPPMASSGTTPRTSAVPGDGTTKKVDPTMQSSNPANDLAERCREALDQYDGPKPSAAATVAARLNGPTGTTLILADSRYWVGCDDGSYKDGKVSMLRPQRLKPPSASDPDAFAVSNLAVDEGGRLHNRYWSAGVLPTGIAKVRFAFPDGGTADAVVHGRFWMIQYQEYQPIPPGQSDLTRPEITVTPLRADGTMAANLQLAWGKQTCAHINHGC
ncbi:MAG TPA: hypothetical protein VFT31_18055 [Kribbella sp.]|nr:hypothetical protein [Kribbella sp.]